MRRLPSFLAVAFAALAPGADEVYPQARGPSYKQVREKGLQLSGSRDQQVESQRQELEEEQRERLELADPDLRARRIAEYEAFLRRLSGRFTISGEIRRETLVAVITGVPEIPVVQAPGTRKGNITGVADCALVGTGVGLNCIFSASWPTIDNNVRLPVPLGGRLDQLLNQDSTPSEQLQTMRPAVLVIGLNLDPPRIRAMMVTADTLAYRWVGKLDGDSAILLQPGPSCYFVVRCYRSLEIVAAPDGQSPSLVLTGGARTTITLTMRRDPEVAAGHLEPILPR